MFLNFSQTFLIECEWKVFFFFWCFNSRIFIDHHIFDSHQTFPQLSHQIQFEVFSIIILHLMSAGNQNDVERKKNDDDN